MCERIQRRNDLLHGRRKVDEKLSGLVDQRDELEDLVSDIDEVGRKCEHAKVKRVAGAALWEVEKALDEVLADIDRIGNELMEIDSELQELGYANFIEAYKACEVQS